jgi:hypothetical protein
LPPDGSSGPIIEVSSLKCKKELQQEDNDEKHTLFSGSARQNEINYQGKV